MKSPAEWVTHSAARVEEKVVKKQKKKTARSTFFFRSPPSLYHPPFFFLPLWNFYALLSLCKFIVPQNLNWRESIPQFKRRSILWPLFHFFDSCRTQSETPFFYFMARIFRRIPGSATNISRPSVHIFLSPLKSKLSDRWFANASRRTRERVTISDHFYDYHTSCRGARK